jgi:hypothetical protein
MNEDAKVAAAPKEGARAGGLTRSVVAGIVSGSIVLVFVKPFLAFLWRFVLSNFRVVSDKACLDAALDYTDAYGFTMEVRLSAFFIGIACGVMFFAYFGRASRRESAEEFERSLVYTAHRFVTSRLATTLFFVLVILTATYGGAKQYLTMQLKASFHQRLAALAPKISEQEYKEILASWANMQTQEDYRRIVATMEAEAGRAGVSLPKFLPGATP